MGGAFWIFVFLAHFCGLDGLDCLMFIGEDGGGTDRVGGESRD